MILALQLKDGKQDSVQPLKPQTNNVLRGFRTRNSVKKVRELCLHPSNL